MRIGCSIVLCCLHPRLKLSGFGIPVYATQVVAIDGMRVRAQRMIMGLTTLGVRDGTKGELGEHHLYANAKNSNKILEKTNMLASKLLFIQQIFL